MLDQDEPGPPCTGPLGPAYVRKTYLLEGSALAWVPAGEEGRGGGWGRCPLVQGGLQKSWGQGCDSSNLGHVFI